MSNLHFVLVIVCFMTALIACVIIGGYGPTVYHYRQVDTYRCPYNITTFDEDLGCEGLNLAKPNTTWSGEIQNLDKLNQEIRLRATIRNKLWQSQAISVDQEFIVKISGKDDIDAIWRPIQENLHVRRISCSQGNEFCSNLTLAWDLYIRHPFYQFNISTPNAGEFLGNVYFNFIFVNHAYTRFELWFRFVFLIITFIVIVIFAHRLRLNSFLYWEVEQKWTMVILFGLLLYNNPFYPLELIVEHWFPIFVNRVLYGTFIVILLLFWLVMLDAFRLHDPSQMKFLTFYLPKLVLLGLFWAFAVTVFTWAQLQLLDDPAYLTPDKPSFLGVSVVLLVLVLIYLLWLIGVVCRACAENRRTHFLHGPVIFFAVFTFLVTLTVIGGLIFGVFSSRYDNSASFVSYLTLFNLYCYVLAILYSPSERKILDPRNQPGVMRLPEESNENEPGSVALDEIQETRV
jgi:hypothetical protein